jgi:O-antigen/teichoic acid export membrane protein
VVAICDAFRDVDQLWQFNRQVLADRLVRRADYLIPKALIAAIFGPAALGCFVIARRMLDELAALLTTPLKAIAEAAVPRSAASTELLHQVIESLYRTAALTALPMFVAVAALAPVLVEVLFGAGWHDSIVLIQVLMLLGVAQTTSSFSELLLKAAGRPSAAILLLGAGVLAQSVAIPLLAQWGIGSVALAIVLRHLACWPIELTLIRNALSLGLRAQLRPLLSPLLAATCMTGVVVLVLSLLAGHYSALLQLIIAVLLATTSYLLALLALAPATVKLGIGLIQAVLRRDQLRFNSLLTVFAG